MKVQTGASNEPRDGHGDEEWTPADGEEFLNVSIAESDDHVDSYSAEKKYEDRC